MEIRGYLQTSLIEWPGKVSSVIFVSRCNFRCPFCHNSNLVDPGKIKKLPIISEKKILVDLEKRKKWIDGVAITGGEPTLQKDLGQFLSKLRQIGFETMLETNGSLPEILSGILGKELVDFVAMDYKAPLNTSYARVVKKEGFKKDKIVDSMVLLMNSGIPFEFRTTSVPGIHDEEVLVKMARDLEGLESKVKWILQDFQPNNCLDPKLNKKKPYTRMEMRKFLRAVKKIIPGAKLRNS